MAEALCVGLPVDAVSMSLLTHTPDRQLLHATNADAMRLEELQFELQEGPCLTASASGRPVAVEDLHGTVTRWPLFGSVARERLPTVGSIYAFPLLEGEVSFGSANLLRYAAGPLGRRTEAAARLAVRAVALVLLTGRPTPVGQSGSLAETHWQRTHQAAGVLAQQLGIGVDEALARLRAEAFGAGRPLPELAEDILTRYLR
ncbi:GAF and ANTAR domain-containing protein [Streptomyces poonensis]|uniref:GAF and ANTAR domain-containing protein n=1 Tax=Streptomyces poonensis TaxID=68255 RepID=UPI00167BEED6|nr:GAF and ANTAR domain-containing protein [Streptomyces poonensis]